MLFRLTGNQGRTTHSGVLEFTAEEGCAYLPFWMMQNLLLEEGALVTVRNVSLPKATMIKLQPQSTDFLDISNPRAVLEHALRNFSCVTVDDVLPIPYNNKVYHLQLKEVKPSPAACIIETDCNVDFEAPVGYQEPVPQKPVTPPASLGGSVASQTSSAAGGANDEKEDSKPPGVRIVDGKIIRPDQSTSSSSMSKIEVTERIGQTGVQLNAATMAEEAPSVEYWAVAAGDGNRLDGKKATPLKEAATGKEVNVAELRAKAAEARRLQMEAEAAATAARLEGGKLLNGQQPAAAATTDTKTTPTIVSKRKTKVGSKFSRLKNTGAAFQGSANSFGK
jgi:ubiquitin fusion degradation protein 1